MRQDELLQEIMNRYGVAAEYPWRRYPQYAVFRHADNRKWFAVLMNPPGRKLGLATAGEVAILNVKIRAEENSLLRGMDGVLPAYHMNKEHWVSLRLDMLPDATLLDLLADSYGLTRAKIRHKLPSSDLL
ncbi:MmcQ/YjbR family DNA-binding protein [uncultured Cardiobacterium sp.]|uniref:MmcQ/YjbR family DNA-binding protein n=1 Tax=uncultured Cardiobacterium sp. TaxID=417619 RepID=UPI0026230847|nr:MmcQ/YjbR family DNA-binding protein [uncultured Cardiobacterium sp.]